MYSVFFMRNFSALVFSTFLVAGATSAVQAQSLVSGFMAGDRVPSTRCYTRPRSEMFHQNQLVGRYRIEKSIGSGGFGVVFLAEDTWLHTRVALKVPHQQTRHLEDLLGEPRVLAALDHPNILRIHTNICLYSYYTGLCCHGGGFIHLCKRHTMGRAFNGMA